MDKFRAKNFNLVLYEEDESHKKAIEKIKKSYEYAMILHDRDTAEDGTVKKEHYHIVLRFKNAKWNTALAEELGIAVNYIEECRSLKRSLFYLIHFYEEDKYHYPLSDVKGTLKSTLESFIKSDGKTESEKVLEIFEEIDNIDSFIYYSAFVKHIAKIGYWDIFRRSSSAITRYLDEHNKNCK